MKTITTIAELMEILESGSKYYGLRKATEHDEEIMERGYLDCSIDMFDDEYADYSEDCELLGGTSAIGISDALDEDEIIDRYNALNKTYIGKTILLISDRHMDYGSDDNEVVLGSNGYGADVEAIVEL